MPVQLTYFPIRGLGEMVRVLLRDQGIEYEEVYSYQPEGWAELKVAGMADGSLPFGQLPRYVDDNGAIVQSQAIMRYLGRKHKLAGLNERETVLCDMVAEEVADFRRAYSTLVYGAQCAPDAVAAFTAPLADRNARGSYLAQIEAFAAKHGGPYLIGASLTYADYILWELLNSMHRLLPDILTAHNTPVLKKWYDAFSSRPALKAYVEADPEHRKKANGNGLA